MISEIPPGAHRAHKQSEEAILILAGSGFSVIDDVRYDWKKHSSLLVPFGSIHQHFNTGDNLVQLPKLRSSRSLTLDVEVLSVDAIRPGAGFQRFGAAPISRRNQRLGGDHLRCKADAVQADIPSGSMSSHTASEALGFPPLTGHVVMRLAEAGTDGS
jgi:hypothetical protein